MNRLLLIMLAGFLSLVSCKHKKEIPVSKDTPFPVMSFIKSQVKNVDTSLFSIRKIMIPDSLHSDTTFIHREEFRATAKDFLALPDLADKEYAGRFTEKKFFDPTMNRVIIDYTPVDPEKEEISREEVLITPNAAIGDKVNSIIIEKVINNKDGYLEQHFLWQVDRSFQVTTTTQAPGQPEKTVTMKVIWNEEIID